MIAALIILGIVLVAFCLKGFLHDDGDTGFEDNGSGGDGGSD